MSHDGFKCIKCGYFTAEWGVVVCPKCGFSYLDDFKDKPAIMPGGEQYNKEQSIAHAKSEIEKLVMSEEEIKKILCVACGDCTDHPADCMMVCNQSTAIRAEQLKRMEIITADE